ncbi:MAG: hypothetical protein ACR2G7_13690 [Acidimicrobiales bacterium]
MADHDSEVDPARGVGREWNGSKLVVAFVIFVLLVAITMIAVRMGAGGSDGDAQQGQQSLPVLGGGLQPRPVVLAAQQGDLGGGKIDNTS